MAEVAEDKTYIVTDLGPGDGGKGTVIQKLCSLKNAHTVLKTGGAQGSHGVRTAKGESFAFSQFGCGTFGGSRTHITKLFVMDPLGLMKEGETLASEWGIGNIFDLITVDQMSLCITPYHRIASELVELSHKDKPRGTVGVGGGQAVRDAENHPELAFCAKDLGKPYSRELLDAIRQQKIRDLADIIANVSELLPADIELAQKQISHLYDEGFVDRIISAFDRFAKQVLIVDEEYIKKNIIFRPGVMVVESSHGVLTDKYHGFHPHTTALQTLPKRTVDMFEEYGYEGKIVKLGITRAYQIRHGAGPMVTASDALTEILLPHSHKEDNRWQGKVRTGALDLVMLRYAIEVCGGPKFFDGLCITWMDQIEKAGTWNLCDSYNGMNARDLFSRNGSIKVRRGNGAKQLLLQQKLSEALLMCQPNVTVINLPQNVDREHLTDLCVQTLEEKLGVPVRMISFGPTELDKVLI